VCGAHPVKLIVTWLVPGRAIKGKSQKRIERQVGLKKNGFKKKQFNVLCFSNPFFRVFLLFLEKLPAQKHYSHCFYCIMPYHHFQNYIITFYTCYGIQIWGQRNVPHLCFRKALLVNSPQSGKVWQACTQQTEKSHSHANSVVSRQVYALLGQHLYSDFFQLMVLYGPTSETVRIQRRQKSWLKSTYFTELKKTTSRIYSNCSNYYSYLFSSPSNFVAVRFVFLENCTVNCTSVLRILLSTS